MSDASKVVHLAQADEAEKAKQLADFLAAHELALVVFGAEWCGPCRELDPVLEKAAAAGLASVLHVDVDVAPELAQDVESVPTLRLFRKGELAGEERGAMPLRMLRTWIASLQSE